MPSTQNEMGESVDWSDTGGMEAGYVYNDKSKAELEQIAQQREQSWQSGVPEQYKTLAGKWSGQQGVMKIIPIQQEQKFTLSTVADIAKGVSAPQPQVIPISDVSVTPHQISFDFFDTTEGKIGISNATEKHMQLECDIYVTDLIYYWWNHGSNGKTDFKGLNAMNQTYNYIESLEENFNSKNVAQMQAFENTTEFIKFRNSFLTQFFGWQCKFVGHTFPTFNGVLTDVKYDIGSGEQFAKWHIKVEEALFTSDTSTDGKKAADESQTSGGDSNNNSQATTE